MPVRVRFTVTDFSLEERKGPDPAVLPDGCRNYAEEVVPSDRKAPFWAPQSLALYFPLVVYST